MSEVYAIRDEETGRIVDAGTGEPLVGDGFNINNYINPNGKDLGPQKKYNLGDGVMQLAASEMNQKALAWLNQ